MARQRRGRLTRVAVYGASMTPTLRADDWLLVRRTTDAPEGSLVVLEWPQRPGLLVVKRVIRRTTEGYWVEGDNPEASDDSRRYGPVPRLWGRVLLRYWPRPVWLASRDRPGADSRR